MNDSGSKSLCRDDFELRDSVARALSAEGVADCRVLAAVSGGSDSMALLELLALCAEDASLELLVAYVDHRLRAESEHEAAAVGRAAERLGTPFLYLQVADPGDGAENRLREQRYAALEKAADNGGCAWIATGHTLDDQIETVIFRFFRGSGRLGLGGMRATRGRLLRPMLELSRAQLREMLVRRGVAWCEDASNSSDRYARNRIRNRLIPLIEETLGRGALDHLPDTARRMQAEEEFLEQETQRHLAFAAPLRASGCTLDLAALQAVPQALRGRVLRAWLLRLGVAEPVEIAHLEALERLAESREGSACVDLAGLAVRREYGVLRGGGLETGAPAFRLAVDPAVRARLADPGGDWVIEVDPQPQEPPRKAASPYSQEVDLEAYGPLWLRPLAPGDSIERAGLHGGRSRVHDLLGELKVPNYLRSRWPVLVYQDELLWVPGVVAAPGRAGGRRFRLRWRHCR